MYGCAGLVLYVTLTMHKINFPLSDIWESGVSRGSLKSLVNGASVEYNNPTPVNASEGTL
jgi:hypothetical protein